MTSFVFATCWMPRKTCATTTGKTRDDLNKDRMFSLALVRLIEIIGEAAANVSEDCRKVFPNIPWSSIVGMRNRLIHAYIDIDIDRVWDTITDDLPPLIATLEKILTNPA
jgi:uncharacterized protein with HEPN domain